MKRTTTLYHESGSIIEVLTNRVEQMKAQGWTTEKHGAKKSKAKQQKSEEVTNG